MAYIKWQNAMSMGIDPLDDEHRGLVQIINRLHEQWDSGQADQAVLETLRDMRAYARVHFEREETLMEQLDYPKTAGHRGQHDDFIEHVSSFEKCIPEKTCLSGDVLTYLSSWLTDHILASDQHFARYVHEKERAET